jgi:nicotinamide mononucleotide transporter
VPADGVNARGLLHLHPMPITEFLQEFVNQLKLTSPLEATAVIFGMISVVLANRNHVGLYPTGIVSTAIFIYLMGKPSVGLYAEALLNVYYFVMSIYGWAIWYKGHESENARAITRNTRKDWATTAGIVVIGWCVLYYLLSTFTNSDVPVWDAIVSSTACAGMWLLAKHKLENWILLNISNAIAIPLLIHKHLPLTAFLTLFLFIVAVLGYIHWRKLYLQSHKLQHGQ